MVTQFEKFVGGSTPKEVKESSRPKSQPPEEQKQSVVKVRRSSSRSKKIQGPPKPTPEQIASREIQEQTKVDVSQKPIQKTNIDQQRINKQEVEMLRRSLPDVKVAKQSDINKTSKVGP